METKIFNYFGRELPNYLGYGVLDESSITVANEVIKADYRLDCDKTIVHRLTWEMEQCEFETFFHGEFAGDSRYPDIARVVSNDFNSRDITSDPIFLFLAKEISKKGNIYVDLGASKDKTAASYFPAGKLMVISLPVPERNERITSLIQGLDKGKIRFYKEKKVTLLRSDQEKKITLQPLVFFEFLAPLAFILEAAEIIAKAEVICPEIRYRMMVTESYRLETFDFQVFRDQEINSHYAIYHMELPVERKEEVIRFFADFIKTL
jgi:hypothetical protein